MGRLLSKLPTDVHLGKFLLVASVFGCLDPALTIAATLNSKSPFLTPFGKEDEAHRQKTSFRIGQSTRCAQRCPPFDMYLPEDSDFLALHNAFSSWRRACGNGLHIARKFCRDAYMSHQVHILVLTQHNQRSLTCFYRIFSRLKNYVSNFWGETGSTRSAAPLIHVSNRYLIDSSFIKVDVSLVRELSR